MDGTQSWCHFVQRFKRTAQQKAAKVCCPAACVGPEPVLTPDSSKARTLIKTCAKVEVCVQRSHGHPAG